MSARTGESTSEEEKKERRRRWHEWAKTHKKERSEYNKIRNRRQFDEVREWLGGRCFVCGSRTALELHHLRERHGKVRRVFAISEARRNPRGLLLLCFRHHKVIHAGNRESYELLKWVFEVAKASSYKVNIRSRVRPPEGSKCR